MKINANQFTLSSKMENFRFFLRRGGGHLLRFLMNRFRWHYYPRWRYVSRFPDHVDIESTNICNMTCPMCYRHKNEWHESFMNWDLYTKIIDECAANKCFSIRLSWRGEPLMHPRFVEMIRYAKKKGICEISTLTNALGLDDKMSRDLIESGLDWLTVSFDGLGETYEKIRRPAKFQEALERLRRFQAIKKELGSKKPVLKVQSVWSAIADDPEAYFQTLSPIVDLVSSISNKDYYTGVIDHDPKFVCMTLWQRLVITCNGDVAQCICDSDERLVYGNVRNQNLREIWHSKKYNGVRRLHTEHKRLQLRACQQCFEGNRKVKTTIEVNGRKVKADFQSTTQNLTKWGTKPKTENQPAVAVPR